MFTACSQKNIYQNLCLGGNRYSDYNSEKKKHNQKQNIHSRECPARNR